MKKFCLGLIVIIAVIISVSTSCKKYYSTTDTQILQALTDTFSIGSGQWDTANGYYYFTKNLNNLNPFDSTGGLTDNTNINDSGAVFIYASVDSGASYEMLPAISDSDYNFTGKSSVGSVTINAVPNPPITSTPGFAVYIKVVSVPSIIQFQYSNVNMKDYNAVKAAFHLHE